MNSTFCEFITLNQDKSHTVLPADLLRPPKTMALISCALNFVLSWCKRVVSEFEALGAGVELTFDGNDSIIRMRRHQGEFNLLAGPCL